MLFVFFNHKKKESFITVFIHKIIKFFFSPNSLLEIANYGSLGMEDPSHDWVTISAQSACEKLNSDPRVGLSPLEVEKRLRLYGLNELEVKEKVGD